MRPEARERVVAIPSAALVQLRRDLALALGADRAVDVLEEAGRAAADAYGTAFDREVAGTLPVAEFWAALDRFLGERGWGRIEAERIHPAFVRLRIREGAEVEEDVEAERPGCALSTGLLAGLVGRAGDGPVEAFEVHCRARGDEGCAILLGSAEAIRALKLHLEAGDRLGAALDRM